jgi:hypothetical protein
MENSKVFAWYHQSYLHIPLTMNCDPFHFEWVKTHLIYIGKYIEVIVNLLLSSEFIYIVCHNLSLGLMTKARGCEGAGQDWSLGITFHVLRNVGELREWTPTLQSELPIWDLEY